MKKLVRKTARLLLIAIASPILLFLVLATLLYIPPVQNFAVRRAMQMLSEEMQMDIRLERVQLAFPLNLALHNAIAIEDGDTLLDARSLLLEVKPLPLFEGRADIEGFSLFNAKVDTKAYIPDTHIKGYLKEFSASAHGIDWKNEIIHIDHALLDEADVAIALSDTAAPDTSTTTVNWKVIVNQANIRNSKLSLSMPGDSIRIGGKIGEMALRNGDFDIGNNAYDIKKFSLNSTSVRYDLPFINVSGTLNIDLLSAAAHIDTLRLQVPELNLRTPHSRIDANASVDWNALTEGAGGNCDIFIDASLGHEDVTMAAKGFLDESIISAYPHQPAHIKTNITGNIDNLLCDELSAEFPGILKFSAKGHAENLTNELRSGKATFNLDTYNLAFVRQLLPKSVTQSTALPDRIRLQGDASINRNDYNAKVSLSLGKSTLSPGKAALSFSKGSLQATASGNIKSERYNISAQAKDLPLGSLLPESGMGDFTGSIIASGAGYDPFAKRTALSAKANVSTFSFNGWHLDSISLNAEIKEQKADIDFASHNTLLEATGKIIANLDECINARLEAEIPMLNLQAISGTGDSITMGLEIGISAYAEKDFSAYNADGALKNIYFITPKRSFTSRDIHFDMASGPEHTHANINAGDLHLGLEAQADITTLSGQITDFTNQLTENIEQKRINRDSLKALLPILDFDINAGKDNPLSNILRNKGVTYSYATICLKTSPVDGITGDALIGALRTGGLMLDSIDLDILQDSTGIKFNGLVKNHLKANPNKFEARTNAYLHEKGVGAALKFYDVNQKVGVDLGLRADIEDEGIRFSLTPHHPILAYRHFTVNPDNYVFLKNDSTLLADVDLLADDGTGLKIYSIPSDSINDITLSVNRINLGELSNVLPYMPRLGGFLNGDLHLMRNMNDNNVSAMAMLSTEGLTFEDIELGNIGADLTYVPKTGGEHYASAFITTNYTDVLECSGTYFNRDGGYFTGDAFLHDFPLKLVNGFLAGTDIALDGNVAGEFSVQGTLENPDMNGSVNFKNAHVFSDVYGFKFQMDEDPVLLESNRLKFDKFELFSTGKQPLMINGHVDLSNEMGLNLNINTKNFELINASKKAKSLVYGKVYSDFNATLRGTVSNMLVRGKLDILDRTDMTYILKDSPITVDNRLKELVQFVDFSDTSTVKEQLATTSGIDLTLNIGINDAARFRCNLSEDGKNYVFLEGGGNLTMRLTQQGEMRLTGRFTTNSGEMKYALPVIPLKTFKLTPGSYVEFTGDILNPTLNIAAKERVKSVVTDNDVPRSVAFDVGVALTRPLADMGLEFTIEAPEDLGIQNQLAAMSPEQRGKTAVAMLATGMYITDDMQSSGTSGFKATNALNAFLQSEIQNIAGSALRTIDINLGVESGTSSAGTTTTDYSFQFSKRFWGDRISVIVGGKVSTGQDADYSAESFINNIAVEYRLDKSASRYIRVFYDRNQHDPFEGQITEGGVGLVLRRKTDRLGELFIFRSPKKEKKDGKH